MGGRNVIVMTLSEAFAISTGAVSPSGRDQLDEALLLIYGELHAAASRLRIDPDIAQESASEAFPRLLMGGPRATLADAQVRTYLRVTVWHAAVDLLRQRGHATSLDSHMLNEDGEWGAKEPRAPGPDPEAELVEAEAAKRRMEQQEVVEWAERFVFDELGPMLRNRRRERYRDVFQRGLDQLRDLWHGRATLDEITGREHGRVTDVERNRVYQQHSRVRQALLEWLDCELSSSNLDASRSRAVRGMIAALRR